VAFFCALGFASLTWQEAVRGAVLHGDEPVRRAIAGVSDRPDHRSPVMHGLADLGDPRIAVPVLVAGLLAAACWGRWRRVPGWWAGPVAYALPLIAVALIVTPLKGAIGRAGPGSLTLSPGYPGLYPSGHTSTATAAYGAAVLALAPLVTRTAARRALVWAAVPLNGAVGVALVYCGYHWPLDVLGGWLLCGALLASAALLAGGLRRAARDAVRSSSGSPG
jgi:undecaprenyl-diphosphatase